MHEPGSPSTTEDCPVVEIILEQLDRVERHVAVLLRFARREELTIETVDLGELVRAGVAQVRSRLERAVVAVAVHAPARVCVAADREKLRRARRADEHERLATGAGGRSEEPANDQR